METFCCKTRIIAGKAAREVIREMGFARLLVVADPFFVENGLAESIAQASGAQRWALFGEVMPDPTVELAAKGTAMVKELRPDGVVALGGGSAMDCAKAMVYFAGVEARLVMIPTTSGSGSEMTDFAVLTHNGVKHPLVDGRLRPEAAVLDASLLDSMPPKLVADGGFDVLTHAVEAFTALHGGQFSALLAKEAFSVAYALLPASFGGDRSVRQRIHNASAMAGLAFTHSGLGLCHALSHALGGAFHLPHGRLNAMLLPLVIGCNGYSCADRYAQLAQAAGLCGSGGAVGVRNLKNALVRLRRELQMPATLGEAGIHRGQVWSKAESIVEATLADPCCDTNPIKVEDYLVRRLLGGVTGRG